jgi:hypothetical protein
MDRIIRHYKYRKFRKNSEGVKHIYPEELRIQYEDYLNVFLTLEAQYGKDYFEESNMKVLINLKNYSLIQSHYLTASKELISNLEILNNNNEVFFQINSLGLKGAKPKVESKKVAVWGDSVVFGFGKTWCDLQIGNSVQIFSGGLEGATAEDILRFAHQKNLENRFDLNIVSLGWHSIASRQRTNEYLSKARDIPNCALMTLPFSIPLKKSMSDIGSEFNFSKSVDDAFFFWGNQEYSVNSCFKLIYDMSIQNQKIRQFARKFGIPLLDFELIFGSHKMQEIDKSRFFDIGHLRPSAYPNVAGELSAFVRTIV